LLLTCHFYHSGVASDKQPHPRQNLNAGISERG